MDCDSQVALSGGREEQKPMDRVDPTLEFSCDWHLGIDLQSTHEARNFTGPLTVTRTFGSDK